ncbi:MAG: hypothetical protein KVP17_003581, partial [Porospora cf. gigantea B]
MGGFISSRGASRVEYSLDRGEFVSHPAGEEFLLPLEGLSPGDHALTLRAVDESGIRSEEIQRSFQVLPERPVLVFETAVKGSESTPFVPGLVLPGSWKGSLQGRLRGGGGITRLTAVIGNAPGVDIRLKPGTEDNDRLFALPLRAKGLEGLVNITLELEELSGRVTRKRTAVLIVPLPEEKDAPLPPPAVGPGLYMPDSASTEALYVTQENPLRGFAAGGAIRSVTLIPEEAPFRVTREEGVISLYPKGEVPPTRVQVDVTLENGKTYSSGALTLFSDTTRPRLEGALLPGTPWLTRELSAEGRVQDISLPVKLEWQVRDGEGTVMLDGRLPVEEESWSLHLPLGALAEGEYFLSLHARDASGNPGVLRIPFHKDITPPLLSQIIPLMGDVVDGKTTLGGVVEEGGGVALLEYSPDGENWEALPGTENFIRSENLTPPEGPVVEPRFRATDRAGNTSLLSPVLTPDPARDLPRAAI